MAKLSLYRKRRYIANCVKADGYGERVAPSGSLKESFVSTRRKKGSLHRVVVVEEKVQRRYHCYKYQGSSVHDYYNHGEPPIYNK